MLVVPEYSEEENVIEHVMVVRYVASVWVV